MRSPVVHLRATLGSRRAARLTLIALAVLWALGACRTHPPGFALDVRPAAVTLEAGGATASIALHLRPEDGFRGEVELEVSGVPAGVTATLSSSALAVASDGAPAAGQAGPAAASSAILTLAASATAAPGDHPPLRIAGRSASPLATASATVALTVSEPSEPTPPSEPANDAFADAEVLTGAFGSVAASTVAATLEAGEPAHAGVAGGGSLWWRWTAPASGRVTFDTHGSAIDTALAAYVGERVDALAPVASDASAAYAFVAFEASAGTTYRVAVVHRDATGGDVALTWASAGTIAWMAEPGQLAFSGFVGQGAPAPQAFALRSDAATTAPFHVSTDDPWIRVEPATGTLSSGAGAQPIEVAVDACAQPSEDEGTLTIRGRGGEATLRVQRLCGIEATHTLSLSGAHGTVAVDGTARALPWAGAFTAGATVTLEALPDAGYVFDRWGGTLSGSANPTSLLLDDDHVVTLGFAPAPAIEVTPASRDVGAVVVGDTATTTFTVRNAGGGTLSGNAGVASPFAIAAGGAYELGTGESATVTVRFDPTSVGSVSRDVTFSGGGGATRGISGEGVPATLRLTVSQHGAGIGTVTSDPPGIDCGAACASDFPLGAAVTLTAEPTSTSVLADWSGCASTLGANCVVEMTEARSVSVTFEPLHVMSVARVYLNQAVPSQDTAAPASERIPLVADRAGLLRVFVHADRGGADDVEVRLHYRQALGEPETVVLLDGPTGLPTGSSESGFGDNFAMRLEPHVVQPGLQAYVSVSGVSFGEAIAARYPESGFWDIDVVRVPRLDLKLMPVTYRSTTPALDDGRAYLERTQRMLAFPDDGIDIEIGPAYAFDGDLSVIQGWYDLIEEMWWERFFDPLRPHYVAVVDAGPDRAVNGVGYLGYPVSVAYSALPGSADTVAHELGHNWGRAHTPCGNPPDPDPGYPYPDGRIGVWGYDLVTRALQDPAIYGDLMGYCRPRWVSDYTYRGVMDYRGFVSADALAEDATDAHPSATPAAEPLLVVTGWRDDDGWRLEAPFVLDAAPEPIPEGPYRLRAWDADGATIVDVTFGTVPLSDGEGAEAVILAIPLGRADAPRLAGLRIEERGLVPFERTATVRPLAARPTQATRLPDGSVRVTWDAQAYAAALLRDGVGGPLLARDRSGEVLVTPSGARLAVLLSDGLNTTVEVLAP